MPQRLKSRGFTLTSLLVVIAIIATLAAILFPVFAQAREKERQATCASNLRQQSMAIPQNRMQGPYRPYIGSKQWQFDLFRYLSYDKQIIVHAHFTG